MSSTNWENYEEVALYLLNQFAEHFNLGSVEGKQVIPGKAGGCWEIDAKGIRDNEEGFLVVECRQYKRKKINQEAMGGLAFRIQDTGAQGGIIVSPLGLQAGAKKIAENQKIVQVTLNPESTVTEYIMEFLNRIFFGMTDTVDLTSSLTIRSENLTTGTVECRRV